MTPAAGGSALSCPSCGLILHAARPRVGPIRKGTSIAEVRVEVSLGPLRCDEGHEFDLKHLAASAASVFTAVERGDLTAFVEAGSR